MNSKAQVTAADVEKTSVGSFIKKNLREYGILLALAIIMVFFQVMTDGTLMQPLNITNLLLQNSYIVIMALAMLLIIVAGHIDLSVGSVAGFIGGLAAVLMVELQWHYIPATIVCLLVGAMIGGLQGYFVAFHKIPAFIVTLGGMLVFRGLVLWLLGGKSIGPFPKEFQLLSSGFIPDPLGGESLRVLSLLIGCVVAFLIFYMNWRERANHIKYGVAAEPVGFVIGKNVVFGGAIVYFTYLLASYKGIPNVVVVMFVLMLFFKRDRLASRSRGAAWACGYEHEQSMVITAHGFAMPVKENFAAVLKLRHWLNPVGWVPGWQSAAAPALFRRLAVIELAVLVVIVISRGA